MRFDVRSECIQIGPSRGTEGISEAHGSDGGGRDGMSPRAAVYASPPDMAESTGAEEGVEIGPCPRCGHSPVLERAVTMVEPRPVPARSPDGCVRDRGKHSLPSVSLLVMLSPRRGRTHDAMAECPSVFVPPLKILSQVLHKIREEKASALLDALYWPNRPWFPDLLEILTSSPWPIPLKRDLLSQADGSVWHPNPEWWKLHVWMVYGNR